MDGIHAFPDGILDFFQIERYDPSVSLDNSRDDNCLGRLSRSGFLLFGHVVAQAVRRDAKIFNNHTSLHTRMSKTFL